MITSNRKLFLPYAAPYFGYVIIASALADVVSIEVNYALRLVAVLLLLAWCWKWYFPITGPKSRLASVGLGIITGFIGLFIWLFLLAPFVDVNETQPWSNTAFVLRIICAGLLVPLFEELFIRGYIFRLAFQWNTERKEKKNEPFQSALDDMSVNDVAPGAWSWAAVIISTMAFTLGHTMQEWLAAVVFSILMALLWIIRKDLLSCIVAHSVTNISLAFYVFYTEKWYFW